MKIGTSELITCVRIQLSNGFMDRNSGTRIFVKYKHFHNIRISNDIQYQLKELPTIRTTNHQRNLVYHKEIIINYVYVLIS